MGAVLEAVVGVPTGAAFEVAIDELRLGGAVRSEGLHEDHVRALAELERAWPPILIWGEDNLVVDGTHRVSAARRLGWQTIVATRFAGTSDDAFVEAIRRNVTHGLPLTLSERVAAVLGVLDRHPEWADRRISDVCALSARSVARLRREQSNGQAATTPAVRVGRDGRTRPLEPAVVRTRILHALAAHPEGSLRAIAAEVGASHETVRCVRKALGAAPVAGVTEVAPKEPSPAGVSAPVRLHARSGPAPTAWGADAALASSLPGQDFAAWFETSAPGEEWRRYLAAVPLSRIYEVADEARTRAAAWSSFAQSLERSVKGPASIRA
jgi:hypothetical protein